ncbi:MAG TPA: hypothetical protein VHV55_20130 [Pirellulales bacterium]|jgi:hypothetical protein|nr:hypothetical protein [Pirellulales bacterium]
MSVPVDDPHAVLRRGVYLLLATIAIGGMLGRLFAVNSVDKVGLEQYLKSKGQAKPLQRPFLSGNDRSRWATVRSLVEQGTYQIDDIVTQPNWDTIDMVKHDDEGHAAPSIGQGHLYSSKPPLLATLVAAPYWVIYKLTGATLVTHPYAIGRGLLVLVNVVPLAIYFLILAKLAERYGASDWGRVFMVACGTAGTFLTTFAVVLNNHVPAAVSAAIALYCAMRIACDGQRGALYFFIGGLAAAFAVANELPALALVGLLSLWLLVVAPRLTLAAWLPGLLIVAAAFFGTNYLAHHSLVPAYARQGSQDNWYVYQYVKDGKVRDSYWMHPEKKSPIDQGEPSVADYALHALVGHHGVFSLSPIWLLSVVGLGLLCVRSGPLRTLGWIILVTSVVCLAFYITLPLEQRNYGGTSSGFRWAFWFAPLWLVALLPAADEMVRSRTLRVLAAVLLCASVVSVSYPTWNPWVQPWLTDMLVDLDWVQLGTR